MRVLYSLYAYTEKIYIILRRYIYRTTLYISLSLISILTHWDIS